MQVLVTGGAGYIGSLTCVALIEAGHTPVIVDNLCNSSAAAVDAVEVITGYRPVLFVGDVSDVELVRQTIEDRNVEAVIHFAGLKAVGESVHQPLGYYVNNVVGTLALLSAMGTTKVKTLVFSSSATVYGLPRSVPVAEDSPRSATNPYGRTKLVIEQILEDLLEADPEWSISVLRYFNPVGAHPSGLMGEDPRGTPNNLMPYIAQVAVGLRDVLPIYGTDYPTPDGTGIRDYVHVMDVAQGHIAALERHSRRPGLHTYNLGTGKGHSVLQLVAAFSHACRRDLPTVAMPRRPGDIAAVWAATEKARDGLNWSAQRSLEQMCEDTWRWQSRYPNGYSDRAQ